MLSQKVEFSGVSMVTATPGVNDPSLGDTRQLGDESYLWVYNTGSSTAGVGRGMVASGVTNYSLTVSSTTMIDAFLGVVKHVAIPTGSYGWLMTKGFCDVVLTPDSGCTKGDLLTVGVDGAFAVKSISTGYPGASYGKAQATTASAGVASAYVKCY